MQQLLALLLIGVMSLGLIGCGSQPAARKAPPSSQAPALLVGKISEVAPPEGIRALNQFMEVYQPQIKILEPRPDQVVSDDQVTVRLQVNDLPAFKDEELALGPHLHIFLDNQLHQELYTLDKPVVLTDLTPGTHTLRVLASRPWHESFKNEGAYAQTIFHIFTKTLENTPNPAQPLLTYNYPQGSYGADPIMLDFYLSNTPLHLIAQEHPDDEVKDWKIRCTINGESFTFTDWQPIYLKGFRPGKNWVQLELLDENGNLFPNPFNNSVQLITYEPGRQDTLSKLIRGELPIALARKIVEPGYVPEPAELPSSSQEPAPETPTIPESDTVPVIPTEPESPTSPPSEPIAPQPESTPEPESTTSPELEAPATLPTEPELEEADKAEAERSRPSLEEPAPEEPILPSPAPEPSLVAPTVEPTPIAPSILEEPTQPKGFFNRFRRFKPFSEPPTEPIAIPTPGIPAELESPPSVEIPAEPDVERSLPALKEEEPSPEEPTPAAPETPVAAPTTEPTPTTPSIPQKPTQPRGFFNRFRPFKAFGKPMPEPEATPVPDVPVEPELPASVEVPSVPEVERSPSPEEPLTTEPAPATGIPETPSAAPVEEPLPPITPAPSETTTRLKGFFNRFRRSGKLPAVESPALPSSPAPTAAPPEKQTEVEEPATSISDQEEPITEELKPEDTEAIPEPAASSVEPSASDELVPPVVEPTPVNVPADQPEPVSDPSRSPQPFNTKQWLERLRRPKEPLPLPTPVGEPDVPIEPETSEPLPEVIEIPEPALEPTEGFTSEANP